MYTVKDNDFDNNINTFYIFVFPCFSLRLDLCIVAVTGCLDNSDSLLTVVSAVCKKTVLPTRKNTYLKIQLQKHITIHHFKLIWVKITTY